jgi:hypothetical protein
MIKKGFLKDQRSNNSKSDDIANKVSKAVKIVGMIALAGTLTYMVIKLSKANQIINKWYVIIFAAAILVLAGLVLKLTQKKR